MTTELVLAGLLCCDCVFCNSLVFYVSTFYFVLWVVVLAFYALTLLVWRHLVCKKTDWWVAGVVICLERGADLHGPSDATATHCLLLQ